MMHYWYGGMGMFWFWLLVLLFLLLVSLLLYFLLRPSQNRRPFDSDDRTTEEALRILNERFARGEISEEEYLRRKELLEKKSR